MNGLRLWWIIGKDIVPLGNRSTSSRPKLKEKGIFEKFFFERWEKGFESWNDILLTWLMIFWFGLREKNLLIRKVEETKKGWRIQDRLICGNLFLSPEKTSVKIT
jgi:hypothetical protein